MKLDHNPSDPPNCLFQRCRREFLYVRSSLLFRQIPRVTDYERVGDGFLVWKELIQRSWGNLCFSSNGVRGCRVVTNFSENSAGRIEQTDYTAFSPRVSLSIRGKN